jgi:hypothetical protein
VATKNPADAPKERKPNPACGSPGCKHPISFHPRDAVKHRRPCKAFGCKCRNYTKTKAPETT